MRTDPSVADLVTSAKNGDERAWGELVERYASLVWSICRSHRLGRADAEDVSQSVWLRLAEHLDRLREPAALPGWLATTTQRECDRVLRAACRSHTLRLLLDAENIPDQQTGTAEQELLAAERRAAFREAFTDLPPRCRQMIALLIEDPPASYTKISATLGIPIGSIGPQRGRCLAMLRRHPAIAALINAEASSADRSAIDTQWPCDHDGRTAPGPHRSAAVSASPLAAGHAASLSRAPGLIRARELIN
jgi:RNA polymerase sigma factor (sigma-70 family)